MEFKFSQIIGKNKKPFIIAEMSANHEGSLNHAKKIISRAKQIGVDAIKIQTYQAEAMTINSDKSDFLIKHGIWKGNKLYDLYKKAQTPISWQKELFDHARKEKVTIFKQDLRGKFISSYNFVKGFNTFSKAKKHLQELVN